MFLLQAKNDYSTGPSELLAPVLRAIGPPSHARLFDPFGTTHQQGHGAFACRSLGITMWAEDVLAFLDASLERPARDAR